MKSIDRRHFCSVAAMASIAAGKALDAQTVAAAPASVGQSTLGQARVISVEPAQERKTATGSSWPIAHGTLATGESVNLHESVQVPGAPEVQIHGIQHSEFVVIIEGEVEYKHEVEGKLAVDRASAGSVLYVPMDTRHAVRNIGSGPARYVVVAIGGDAK